MPVIGSIGALGLAPAQGLAGLIAGPPNRRLLKSALRTPALIAAALFVMLEAASTFWSIDRATTQAVRLLAGAALGVCFICAVHGLAEDETQILRRVVVASVLFLLGLLVAIALSIEFLVARFADPAAPERFIANPGRGVSYALFLLWPVCALLLEQGAARILVGCVIAAAGWLSFQFDLTANLVAFCVGLAVFAAGWLFPRAVLRAVSLLLAGLLLLTPFIAARLPPGAEAPESWPSSWAFRLDLWRYSAERVFERPWFGWGIDAARGLSVSGDLRGGQYTTVFQHPHCSFLQIWLETGALGAAIAAGALAIAGWTLGRSPISRSAAAGLAAAWASYWTVANLAHGLWQEWLVTGLFSIGAAALLVHRAQVRGACRPSGAKS